jgi:mannose-6-phosphate isomerase
VDKDGNPRELHIKKALDVIDYKQYKVVKSTNELLADNKYFTVKEVNFDKELEINANERAFISFTFLEGEGKVDDIPYSKYDTFFLPFGKKCLIKGKGKAVISTVR